MRERLLLGPVLIAALIGGIALDQFLQGRAMPAALSWLGTSIPPGVVILPICILLGVLAAREMAAILASKGVEASKRMMTFAAASGLLVSCLVPVSFSAMNSAAMMGSVAAIVLVTSLGFYSRHKTTEGVVAATGGVMLAFVYLGLMFGFLPAIRREHSAWILLWILLVTKSCDIGAYFTGKAIGRHKLIPWLSPGKTWEGLAGGVVFAAAVSWAGLLLLERAKVCAMPPLIWALLPGVVFAVVGQAGDLLESMLKRDAGMKDSGRTLPGFGGVLDVLDSPLLVAPLAYWLLRAYERAGLFGSEYGG